jgi:3-phenylpropionate/trans-cinnamate dioxygenase ferredoxin reductase subunit
VNSLIIGAGETGVRAALKLREDGYAGTITLVNGEAHTPYERPPLSKSTGEPITLKPVSGADQLAASDVTLLTGERAHLINRTAKRVELESGATLPYDRLLIATGATPRALTLNGLAIPSAFTLRTYDDAIAIESRMLPGARFVIIGGGFIGLELAAMARAKGVDVSVIETQPRLLARAVPAEIATRLEQRHRDSGVTFHLGAAITSITPDHVITLANGETLRADTLIAGIGSIPATSLAEQAGLLIDNGIAVDATLATSDPDIFAAGDCCSFPHPVYGNKRIRIESWRAAQQQGDHAARAMMGSTEPFSAVPWFWTDQYDLSVQIAGLPSEGVTHVRRETEDGSLLLFHLATGNRLIAASGIGLGNAVARDIRLSEMLIDRRALLSPDDLANPAIRLKALLAAH